MTKVSSTTVSIVMPVFNAENTLDSCLKSIFSQTLQDFEVLAIDDFSTDRSVAILMAQNDERIRVINNKAKGIVSALNIGLSHCRSDYVARMDADDVMHPQRLAKQIRRLKDKPELALCATQAKKFPEQLVQAGYVEYMRWQNACITQDDISSDIYIESPFAHPSVMFRRQKIIRLGGYLDGEFPEDYELWLRLFHAGEKMEKIDEVLLDWRESETRLSRNSARYSDIAFDQLRARYLVKDKRLQDRDVVIWGAGRKTRQRVKYLIDLGVSPSAWIDIDDKKIGQSYHRAMTYSPDWLQRADLRKKPLVLNYVRNRGARDLCRAYLDSAGYQRGRDYIDVA